MKCKCGQEMRQPDEGAMVCSDCGRIKWLIVQEQAKERRRVFNQILRQVKARDRRMTKVIGYCEEVDTHAVNCRGEDRENMSSDERYGVDYDP
jgi:hypothetical protein